MNAADTSPTRRGPGPPAEWLDPLAARLDAELRGLTITGAAAGKGWLSLRLTRGFLWMVARGALRQVWITNAPFDRRRLDVLGRRESPLSEAVLGRRICGAEVLSPEDGRAEGLCISLDGPWPALQWRGWPRPGAIWISDETGTPRAQDGRMEGETLRARAARDISFDAATHDALCQLSWEDHLAQAVRHRLGRILRQRGQSLRRKQAKLRADLSDGEELSAWRADADLLAAHLHEVQRGMDSLECLDFEGRPRTLALDPLLLPHQNLDRAYRKVKRSEARNRRVRELLEELDREVDLQLQRETHLDALAAAGEELDNPSEAGPQARLGAWLDAARDWSIDLRPAPDPRSGRAQPTRRPYWTYRLDGEWELRVGRSAADNDELLRLHRAGRDLWFHAQGVTGSHVILRRGEAPVPGPVLERAAQLAAHFSKARNSQTVPVIYTERRYVRKPRKAPPGMVTVEREQTLFVSPAIAPEMQKVDS